MIKIIKKDGVIKDYNEQNIIDACQKASSRALEQLSETDYASICNRVIEIIEDEGFEDNVIQVSEMHTIVVRALEDCEFAKTAESYRSYRNYKTDFAEMMNEVYTREQEVRYIGDKSNANTDSSMVATQCSLSYGILSGELYNRFFLNKEELQTINDGYIYIHDKKNRRDTFNCCIADVENILTGGFEMGNIWYNEPKTLDVAFDVISDIIMSMASQQYGGYTVPEVDKLLAPYAEKSYNKYYDEACFLLARGTYNGLDSVLDIADEVALAKVQREMEQGFQAWEYKFNTVGSSRGDYVFTSISFGLGKSKFEKMVTECCLNVRREGQGKDGYKKPVLFPKLTFLYDEELHGEGKELEHLFECSLECSRKAMYPDVLSMSGEGYIPSMYKKYGKVVSLMG